VLTEARESGRSGICTPDGQPRQDVVEAILGSGLDAGRMLRAVAVMALAQSEAAKAARRSERVRRTRSAAFLS
jgi:hypothetical protein